MIHECVQILETFLEMYWIKVMGLSWNRTYDESSMSYSKYI